MCYLDEQGGMPIYQLTYSDFEAKYTELETELKQHKHIIVLLPKGSTLFGVGLIPQKSLPSGIKKLNVLYAEKDANGNAVGANVQETCVTFVEWGNT